jgi:hypothetical protein
MPLTIPSIDDVDQEAVDNQSATLTQLLQEYIPEADLKRGLLHDYVLHLSAIMSAVAQTNVKRITDSLSLKQIQADPTLADTDLVDNVLSNWGVVRITGAPATGQVTIALSERMTVVIPSNSVFTIAGRTFETTTVFAARTSSTDVISPTDKLLTASGSLWVFTIDVQDTANGASGNVKRGTPVTVSQPPPKFSTAYVEADFTGGVDDETNAQLMARLPSGLSAKLWGGRGNVDAMVRYQFPETIDLSVIGFGDPEMQRDKHLLWPGSSGGRADIYVRTSRAPLSLSISKTAALVSKVGAVGTWQFTLSRNDCPGFYEVEKILTAAQATTASGFQPSSDGRSYDLTDDQAGLLPDVTTAAEASYSYFQTATIQFADTVTDAGGLSLGATASYKVILRCMPLVKDIQNFLRDRDYGSSLGDALVKAVTPCFVSATMTLTVPRGTATVDTSALQQKVADAINTLGFTGRLAGSQAVKPVVDAYPQGSVTAVTLTGRLRRPDGTTLNLVGADSISIPDEPSKTVTGRTVGFLCSPTDVAITVVTATTPVV